MITSPRGSARAIAVAACDDLVVSGIACHTAAVLAAATLIAGCGDDGPRPITCDADGVLRSSEFHEVESQAALDALRGCTRVAGSLAIRGPAIEDLAPLSSLERVDVMLILDELSVPLTGLENLASVGVSLTLKQLAITDLSALSELQALGGGEPIEGSSGHLEISFCDQLESLQGIGPVAGLRSLTLNRNPRLTSLAGLRVAPEVDDITLINQPLEDLVALAELRAARWIRLRADNLSSLAGLESLEEVEFLSIEAPDLVDLDALGALVRADLIELLEVRGLRDVGGVTSLTQVSELRVEGARDVDLSPLGVASLERVDLVDLAEVSFAFPEVVALPGGLFLEDNAGVGLAGFSTLEEVGGLRIRGDTALTSLGGSGLQRVTGSVSIDHNAALVHQDAVDFAAGLEVAGAVKIYANVGSPPPLDPCPFASDDVCDEDGLCAEGTDPDCDSVEAAP